MNRIEYEAYYRQGLIDGLVARGVGEKTAEAFVADAQNAAIGAMNPKAYAEGFKETLSEKAAQQIRLVDEDDDDSDNEDFFDKLKRYLTYGGLAAGGFLAGNYFPEIKATASKMYNSAMNTLAGGAAGERAAQAPDTRPAP